MNVSALRIADILMELGYPAPHIGQSNEQALEMIANALVVLKRRIEVLEETVCTLNT